MQRAWEARKHLAFPYPEQTQSQPSLGSLQAEPIFFRPPLTSMPGGVLCPSPSPSPWVHLPS